MTTYADPHHTMLTLVAGGTVTIEPESAPYAADAPLHIDFPWHADGRKLDDQVSADELLLCDLVDIHLPTGQASLTTKGRAALAVLTNTFERGFRVGSVVVLRAGTGTSHHVVCDAKDPVAVVGTACNPSKLPKRYTFDLVPVSHGVVCHRCNGVNLNGGSSRLG